MTSSRVHSYRFGFIGSQSNFLLSGHILFRYCHLFYVNSKFQAILINIYVVIYFVKFYHAGTDCARLCAGLLVCFDRPVGWKQPVKLHLIKLMRQKTAVTLN